MGEKSDEASERGGAVVTPRVVVADDDGDVRAVVAEVLRADGYEVVEASDGGELLALLESSAMAASRGERGVAVSAVVSDVRMPWFGGMDVLTALRCAAWSLPVILMTAYGDDETHAEARDLGASAVLDKPFDLDVLRRAVREAVPRC
jgi:CheY-like chemotaxis protein